jgi:hypothetical protein
LILFSLFDKFHSTIIVGLFILSFRPACQLATCIRKANLKLISFDLNPKEFRDEIAGQIKLVWQTRDNVMINFPTATTIKGES